MIASRIATPAPRTVAARMMAARRAGAGLYLREWRLSGADLDPAPAAAFVDAVIGWLRDTRPPRAASPRHRSNWSSPSLRAPSGAGVPVSVRFPRLRPMDLYRPERIADRLYAFLCDQRGAGESSCRRPFPLLLG
ncbi:MAG: hypothetical protein U0531_10560 [Dehalococcoidia bacterium]